MNYNPSPKSQFIKNADLIKRHREIVQSDAVQSAVAIALLEMSRQICNNMPAENMGACAAGHLRMLGAQDFVAIFLNLAEEAVAVPKQPTMNLPGNVTQLPKKGN